MRMTKMLENFHKQLKEYDLPDLEADLCEMLLNASFEVRREVAKELIRLWIAESVE